MAKSQKEGTTWNKQTPVVRGSFRKPSTVGATAGTMHPHLPLVDFNGPRRLVFFPPTAIRNATSSHHQPRFDSIDVPRIIHFQRWSLTLRSFSAADRNKGPSIESMPPLACSACIAWAP